ncbi:MAG: transposase [Paracoccaceae bacterium]|nr:transposase [Paracoccaceae bacterium]
MPNYLRPRVPGATIFFTVALADRGSDLLVQRIDLFRSAFNATLKRRPVAVDALVVLPDHLHAVLTLPGADNDYALRWRQIKTRFSLGLPKGRLRQSHVTRAERGIWQRRYWEHHIRDAEDYRVHVEYCWWNPVKHGFVERARDWPHSSLHRDIRMGRAGPEWM